MSNIATDLLETSSCRATPPFLTSFAIQLVHTSIRTSLPLPTSSTFTNTIHKQGGYIQTRDYVHANSSSGRASTVSSVMPTSLPFLFDFNITSFCKILHFYSNQLALAGCSVNFLLFTATSNLGQSLIPNPTNMQACSHPHFDLVLALSILWQPRKGFRPMCTAFCTPQPLLRFTSVTSFRADWCEGG
jgi:hypothetical protein